MSGPPVPQYGNFGGNGDNDAWEQADRYYTFVANGYDPDQIRGGAPGSGTLPDPRDFHAPQIVHLNRTPDNVEMVKLVLEAIDRKPRNDVDTAYLNHDLGYVEGDVITNVINNQVMGANVWLAILANGEQLDDYGRLYGLGSVPFIGIGGTAWNIISETKAQIPSADFYTVEEIVVTAEESSWPSVMDLTAQIWGAGGTMVEGIVSIASQAWTDFKSAVGSAFSAISGAVGSAWSWFEEHLLHQDRLPYDPLWGDLRDVTPHFVQMTAGDHIGLAELPGYDDNADGFISLDDGIAASLGIFVDANSDGVLSFEELRGFNGDDAIDIATGLDTAGNQVFVGVLYDFLSVEKGHVAVSEAGLVGEPPRAEELLFA